MANTSEETMNSTLGTSLGCVNQTNDVVIFFYTTMSVCMFMGTPAHLWCLWLYFGFSTNIKPTQVLLLNHNIMELLSCVQCGTEILAQLILKNNSLRSLNSFPYGLSWSGRPLIQICICIERYFAVLHPVTFMKYKGIKYRIGAVAGAWLVAFGYGLFQVYVLVSTHIIFNVVFIVAVAVTSFCCLSVLCALKHPAPGHTTHTTRQIARDVRNQQKKNAFNVIFSMLIVILLTYTPLGVLSIFTVVEVQWMTLYCNVVPFILNLSRFSLIFTPLLKIYKGGILKQCLIHRIK